MTREGVGAAEVGHRAGRASSASSWTPRRADARRARRRAPAAPAARAREAGARGGPGARLDAADVDELTAPLGRAPGLVAGRRAGRRRRRGRDARPTSRCAPRASGCQAHLLDGAARARGAHEIAARSSAARAAQIKRGLRMPPKAADRLIADVRRAGRRALRRAIEQLADLELDLARRRRGRHRRGHARAARDPGDRHRVAAGVQAHAAPRATSIGACTGRATGAPQPG